MKCDKCKKAEAMIHVEGVGDFCLDCYNDIISRAFGTEKFDNYSRHISVYDVDGEIHQFEVWNMLLPEYSIWHADEMGGGYRFEVMTGLSDNQSDALYHLHQKILLGIGYKSLQEYNDKSYIENAYHTDNRQFTLKEAGTGRIEDTSEKGEYCIVIDGQEINFEDFGRMASTYTGFNMVYQFCDLSDEVLGKEMVLRKFNINPHVLMARFEKSLQWFIDDDFLSEDFQEACEEALAERIEELEVLYNYGNREKAMRLGEWMKERLEEIATDSEDFPEWLVKEIDGVLELD